MHKLLFCIAGCTALNKAAGDASPGALVAALGAMLCCTSVATCEACCCFSYSTRASGIFLIKLAYWGEKISSISPWFRCLVGVSIRMSTVASSIEESGEKTKG